MYHGIVCLVHHPGIGELIMTRRIGLLAYAVLSALLCLGAAPLSPLRVSDNGHFLVTQDGTPFFWLGDTAWSLTKLSNDDIRLYLADRAAKGFTGIQVTGGFNFHLLSNLIVRPEIRQDWAPGAGIDEDTFLIDAILTY